MPRRAAKMAASSFGSTHVISNVAIWTSAGLLPAETAPCSINPRYSASDSSVSQFAITPSATSAAVRTIFGPSPANDSHRLFGTRQRLLDHDSVAALHETDSAGAKAKGAETTLREVVNTARAHGEECRRTRIEVDDRRAEADGLGLSRHDGENSESVFA